MKGAERAKIEALFNWPALVAQARAGAARDEYGELIGRVRLGTNRALTPSGRAYRIGDPDVDEADEAWHQALDEVAEAWGGWIEHGVMRADADVLYFAIVAVG